MTGAEDPTATVNLSSAKLQAEFAKIAGPALRAGIANMLSDLGDPGTEPASVRREFAQARDKTNAEFDTAQKRSEAQITQEVKQGGGQYSGQAVSEIVARQMRLIDRQRTQATSALNFQEAQAGMDQTAFLLNATGQAGFGAAGGALGFGANAVNSGQILARLNQQGAQEGSTYGSLIGTIIGAALAGYTGGASIPLGAAAGGAVGGWIGGG